MVIQPYNFQQQYLNNKPVFKANGQDVSVNLKDIKAPVIEAKTYENPVSKTGEYFIAMNHSYKRSLKTAGRVFLEIARAGGIPYSDDAGSAIAFTALLGLAVGLGVFVVNFPLDMYNANVKFFTKSKEMDVYVRNNAAEQTIYEKLDTKAEEASLEEKDELYGQFMKMKTAHTEPSKLLLLA